MQQGRQQFQRAAESAGAVAGRQSAAILLQGQRSRGEAGRRPADLPAPNCTAAGCSHSHDTTFSSCPGRAGASDEAEGLLTSDLLLGERLLLAYIASSALEEHWEAWTFKPGEETACRRQRHGSFGVG